MIRFEMYPFNIHPKEDGEYVVMRPNGTFDAFSYTTEYGWNTFRYYDGNVFKVAAISAEEMQSRCKYWLKPISTGTPSYYETITEMIEQVRQDLIQYADRKLSEPEQDRQYWLDELYEHLEEAKDFAESLQ